MFDSKSLPVCRVAHEDVQRTEILLTKVSSRSYDSMGVIQTVADAKDMQTNQA